MPSLLPRSSTLARTVARLAILLFATPAMAATVVLEPSKDNTLYEEITGALSNGSGDHIHTGVTGRGRITRGLLEFDVAGNVPAGATITSVSLALFMSRSQNGAVEATTLHRVQQEWGEGASDAPMGEGVGALAVAPDATWLDAETGGAAWATAGGDFDATPSAGTSVGGVGFVTFTSAQLAADVQLFLDDDAQNHGWILIGNEAAQAKRFDSRDNGTPGVRPQLTIEFAAAPVPSLGATGAGLLLGLLVATAGAARQRRAR